jgi:hypothetical protein
MTRSLAAVTLLGLALAPSGLVAQEAARPRPTRPAPVFPVEAHIVWIDVVAADSRDRPVTDLGPEDFEVVEAASGAHRLFSPQLARPTARSSSDRRHHLTARRSGADVEHTLSKAVAGDRAC